jgi:hypothetical protein
MWYEKSNMFERHLTYKKYYKSTKYNKLTKTNIPLKISEKNIYVIWNMFLNENFITIIWTSSIIKKYYSYIIQSHIKCIKFYKFYPQDNYIL